MKMVSAAKLKKAQDAIIAMKPYAYKLKQLLEHLSSALGSENVYNPRKGAVKRVLLVAITSNRGLCGAFNANVVKKVIELTQTTYKDKEVHYYTIGKKGNDVLKKTEKVLDNNNHIFDKLTIQPVVTDKKTTTDYLYEPSKQEIVTQLIPRSLKTQLFKALRDSVAAEHGARMTAMHKATDNAQDLKNELILTYNKARQATITGEIIEIVGGSEALS